MFHLFNRSPLTPQEIKEVEEAGALGEAIGKKIGYYITKLSFAFSFGLIDHRDLYSEPVLQEKKHV